MTKVVLESSYRYHCLLSPLAQNRALSFAEKMLFSPLMPMRLFATTGQKKMALPEMEWRSGST